MYRPAEAIELIIRPRPQDIRGSPLTPGSLAPGFLILVLAVLALAACASREVLVPKRAEPPPRVDFSGQWQLRNDAREQQRRINDAIRQTDGVDDTGIIPPPPTREGQPPRRRRDPGGLVHVFLEHGKHLKITQTDAGMFLSFDRAIVEEFRFGENREVQVGPVVADRVSGWEGAEYVVETLDKNNMKLTERFALEQNGEVLRRTITLRGKDKQERTIVQLFDRA